MALKVKMIEVDGEKRIPPEVMDLLLRLGEHRDLCHDCEQFMRHGIGDYCPTGRAFILELAALPGVEFS